MIERWRIIRALLKESCKYAEEYGVTLALQNHAPVISTWKDVRDMVLEVDSPWLKICFDLNRECDNPAIIKEAFDEIGHLDVHYHYNGEWARDANGAAVLKPYLHREPQVNYEAFVRELKRINYDGYLAFEFCHPASVNGFDIVGIDYIDDQALLALEYTKALIAKS
jgi:sugar phosphate isomerase/epimerase